MKKAAFYLLLVFATVVVCELGLQGLYVFIKGKFVWERDEFRVRDFTQRVNDGRYITAKPSYQNASYEEGAASWDIAIDSHGFRVGSNSPSDERGNIAFIGDSVPFGYGVGSKDTVPSQLQGILRERHDPRGVINAAIPSYSLDQAVQRFRYELAGHYNIDSVILQVYDPASQFAQLGWEWDVTKNWTTTPVWEGTTPLLRYSALWHILYYHLYDVYIFSSDRLRIDDEAAISRYVLSINDSLDMLSQDAKGRVRTIIILPATLPPATWVNLSEPQRVARRMLNQTLKRFTERHSETQFIDTNALFASDPDDRAFIDECCHLSREGAARVATVLAANLPAPTLPQSQVKALSPGPLVRL